MLKTVRSPHVCFPHKYILFNGRKKIPVRRVFLIIYLIWLINIKAARITQKESVKIFSRIHPITPLYYNPNVNYKNIIKILK